MRQVVIHFRRKKARQSSVGACYAGIISVLLSFLMLFLPVLADTEEVAGIFDLSIEELMTIEIPSSATLTGAKPRLVPAAVTMITEEQIQASGARSLNELLDIYVPNFQWIRSAWEPDNVGLRGIIGDRDDKYLLTVNGKVMNDRSHYGVISERDLVLLRDIRYIEVVRGPGSAMYGPGAVSMVINIVTHSGETFQGTDITTRAGAVEEFYSTEIRHGRAFSDEDGGIFLYAGIGKYRGADKHRAPTHYGFDFPSESSFDWWNPDWGVFTGPDWLPADGTGAGDAMTGPSIPGDGQAFRNLPPLKFFGQINRGDWTYWVRYTRGGQTFPWATGILAREPYGWADWISWDWDTWEPVKLKQNGYGYQQLTGYAGYDKSLTEQTELSLAFSYDFSDYKRFVNNGLADAYREDEYYGRALVRHTFNDRHKAALGVEVSHHELGYSAPGWPHTGFLSSNPILGSDASRWSTNLYSIFGEHQWNINDQWTTFIGARLDDHTYSDKMFSPRASLIHTPNEKDTYKLMWSRSVRANFEEEMRAAALSGQSDGDPEKLDSLEFRYERAHTKNLDLAATLFWHYNLELIAYSSAAQSPVPLGTQRNWGFELEAYYKTETTRFGISHGFTKLYDFNLRPGQDTSITAEPYGGSDFAMWSNHVTKLTASHKLNDQWTADGSLRMYWGFGGIRDYEEYQLDQDENYPIDPNWKRGYRGNYYLNLGVQYRPNKNMTFRLDGMNLLGIFDKDLNKRNYGASGAYRSHAPAVVFTMNCAF